MSLAAGRPATVAVPSEVDLAACVQLGQRDRFGHDCGDLARPQIALS